MNKSKIIIVIVICVLLIFSVNNSKLSVEDEYYNQALDSAGTIYGITSEMLMYDNQDDVNVAKIKLDDISIKIRKLDTNSITQAGETLIFEMLIYANEVVKLQEQKINNDDVFEDEKRFNTVDLIESRLIELTDIMYEIKIKLN